MNEAPPRVGTPWYHPQQELDVVICLTQVEHWVSHYSPEQGRSVRCSGDNCPLCAKGWGQQLRVVIGVQSAKQGRCLMELRERHRQVFEGLEIGRKIRVCKTGSAKNSPVECALMGLIEAEEWSIAPLVAHLGLNPFKRNSDQTSEAGTVSETA